MTKIIKLTDTSNSSIYYVNTNHIVIFNRYEGDDYTSVIIANSPNVPIITVKETPDVIMHSIG